MRRWRSPSQLVPLVFILVAIGLSYLILQMREPPAFQQISAKVWPTTLVIALFACGVLIFVENARGQGTAAEEEPQEAITSWNGWLLVGVLALAGPGMLILGYWITCVLLLLAVALLYDGLRHPVRMIVVSVSIPTALFLLFARVLHQAMPLGMFF